MLSPFILVQSDVSVEHHSSALYIHLSFKEMKLCELSTEVI